MTIETPSRPVMPAITPQSPVLLNTAVEPPPGATPAPTGLPVVPPPTRTPPEPPRRKVLGRLDGLWGRAEALVDALGSARAVGVKGETERAGRRPLNPLYHLGGLSVLLLTIVIVTGVYLVLFYKPDAERAYASVAAISGSPVGSIVRSVHRYASQALVVVLVLHALKMLFADRFWGARWLSWVSGWVMLAVFWSIGVLGYWLVWDERAQWLTEYVARRNSGTALAFAGPEAALRNSSFFIIILFLHVFVPVVTLLAVWFHVMRLARVRLWAPRWLAIEVGLVLVAVALWRPAQSAGPADLTRIVREVQLDGWFLGFLPLAERFGIAGWVTVALVGVALLAVPWALRGRPLGPAVVTDAACTGCDLCQQQCPYGAIDMRPRSDGLPYATVAVVNPTLCTGCGLCVGVCSTDAIDLLGQAAGDVQGRMQRALTTARARGESPVAVFACARHIQMGTVPATHDGSPVIACGVPCAGMVHGEWLRQSLLGGARAALIVGGPHDDCAFREGPRWTHERLRRRDRLQRQGVAWLEVAPGDRAAVSTAIARLTRGDGVTSAEESGGPAPKLAGYLARTGLRLAAALVPLLAIAGGVALLAERPVAATAGQQAELRIVVAHKGKVKAAGSPGAGLSAGEQARLPQGVSAAQILGGERHPVRLRVQVGGNPAVEREYRPAGLHKDGVSNGVTTLTLAPGTHQVQVELMDDGATWRTVYQGPVVFESGRVRILTYEPAQDTFSTG